MHTKLCLERFCFQVGKKLDTIDRKAKSYDIVLENPSQWNMPKPEIQTNPDCSEDPWPAEFDAAAVGFSCSTSRSKTPRTYCLASGGLRWVWIFGNSNNIKQPKTAQPSMKTSVFDVPIRTLVFSIPSHSHGEASGATESRSPGFKRRRKCGASRRPPGYNQISW